jgi:stage II sporulation protein D
MAEQSGRIEIRSTPGFATMIGTSPTSPSLRGGFARRVRRSAAGGAASLVALLLVALAAAPVASGASQTMFTLVGRGWGHGIGMCQWGAYGYAKHGWTYDQIIEHYYTGVKLGHVANDSMRVMLNEGMGSAKVSSASAYTVAGGGDPKTLPGGSTATVTWSGGKYRVSAGGKSYSFGAPLLFTPGTHPLKLANESQIGYAGHYKGTLRLIHYSGGLMVVNRLPLEQYICGVLPREVSPSWPLESLKAQAVAARSFAVRARGGSGPFDVYCTARSQCYVGTDQWAAATTKAVNQTAGVVPLYGGKPIEAFYFSTSGGHTENIENVWQTSPVPYLKGVVDKYDYYSPLHIWPEDPMHWSAAKLAGDLGTYSASHPAGVKGVLQSIYVVKRGVSPRVVKAAIIGDKGITWVSGSTLRFALNLRDTWVYFTTMSISPAAAQHKTISAGDKVTVSGRMYPALAKGTKVTLNFKSGSAWHTVDVATHRASQSLGSGKKAYYSTYALTVAPAATTQYYFTHGDAQSPHTVVTVKQAVKLSGAGAPVQAGSSVQLTGTVAPPTAGGKVWLQTKKGSVWTDAASGKQDKQGAFTITWKAVAGVAQVRARAPATTKLAAGFSAALAINVVAQT